ncbi:MAG: hypothetical protein Q4C56_09955 [Peptococcaceae bacterium]|nr:hypothetical protein [Peptococcaceae bacterium]
MSAQDTSKAKRDLTWLHFIIILALMFGFGYLPPIGTVTTVGMKMLGVFLGLLYGWSTCGMLFPSLLGWVAIGFSGIAPVKDIMTQGFGNEIIIFLVFILVLVQMLADSGAVDNVANYIITRPWLQGRPWLFSAIFLCVCGLLASFGQAFAAFLLCWGILFSIFDKVGYRPYEMYPAIMIIGVIISASPFGIMLPFKAMPMVILNAFSSITQIQVGYLPYMLVMIPAGLLMIAGYILACRFILRPDVSKMKNCDVTQLVQGETKVTKHQKAVLFAFGVVLLLLLIPGVLPTSWKFTQLISGTGNAALMALCTVAFSLIKVEGKPILDFNKSVKDGLNWPIIFMLVVIMLLTSLLMSDATGIQPWLVGMLSPVLTKFSGLGFLIALFVITLVLTQFMNNIIVGVMFLPILGTFYETVGANPVVGTMLILLAINTAFLTPAASPATAMCFAQTGWIHTKDIFKIMAICVVTFTVLGLPLIIGLGHVLF